LVEQEQAEHIRMMALLVVEGLLVVVVLVLLMFESKRTRVERECREVLEVRIQRLVVQDMEIFHRTLFY
jgi:hypothetical protein